MPSEKRSAVKGKHETHGVSPVRSCDAVGLARAAYFQAPIDWQVCDVEVIEALKELVDAHPRWGVWKYIDRLRVLDYPWNHKRIFRIYRQLR